MESPPDPGPPVPILPLRRLREAAAGGLDRPLAAGVLEQAGGAGVRLLLRLLSEGDARQASGAIRLLGELGARTGPVLEGVPEPISAELAGGRGQRAADLRRALGRRDAYPPCAALDRGIALVFSECFGDAVVTLRPAAEAEPERADLRLWLGRALAGLGLHEQAAFELAQAARLAPEDLEIIDLLAVSAERCERKGSAFLAARAWLDRHPGGLPPAGASRLLAFVADFEEWVRKEHAVEPRRYALAEGPLLLGLESLRCGRYREAADELQATLRLVPGHVAAWGCLGSAYLGLGRAAEARECWQRALELDPEFEPARTGIEKLDRPPR